MADTEQVADTASNADDQAGQSDKSTETAVDKKTAEAPDDSAKSAAGDDDQGAEGDDADKQDGDDANKDDSEAEKERNREGYKIRQLVDSNPAVQLLREKLQPVVDNTTDAAERKDLQRDLNDYVKDVARTHDDLNRDNEQVAVEIPIFRARNADGTPNPAFRKPLLDRALAQYARDMAIYDQNGVTDANGNRIIVGYRMRLLDYMREKAEDYGFGSKKPGQEKQLAKPTDKKGTTAADKAKMDAAADTPGGQSPSGSKAKGDDDDPFVAGFNDPYGRHKPTGAHSFSRGKQ